MTRKSDKNDAPSAFYSIPYTTVVITVSAWIWAMHHILWESGICKDRAAWFRMARGLRSWFDEACSISYRIYICTYLWILGVGVNGQDNYP